MFNNVVFLFRMFLLFLNLIPLLETNPLISSPVVRVSAITESPGAPLSVHGVTRGGTAYLNSTAADVSFPLVESRDSQGPREPWRPKHGAAARDVLTDPAHEPDLLTSSCPFAELSVF